MLNGDAFAGYRRVSARTAPGANSVAGWPMGIWHLYERPDDKVDGTRDYQDGTREQPHFHTRRPGMSKLFLLTLALASFSVILSCSRDEPAPATQPEKVATATVAPEAKAESTLIPQEDRPEHARDHQTSERGMGLPPGTLRPAAVDDPQAFLSALSPGERSCLFRKSV